MLNFNGNIVAKSDFGLAYDNRGFSYGDAIFDTCLSVDNKVQFLEEHYFRLMASMRILRMEIPLSFTQLFFQEEIQKVILANKTSTNIFRIKFTVFRDTGGFFTPITNRVSYLIEANESDYIHKETYTIDVFKDYRINADLLSTIKTNNRILNVVSSNYARENNVDNCVLINNNKNIVECNNANIFLIFENRVVTPKNSDGCIKGVMRKKVIESIKKRGDFIIEEKSLSPFDLQKADAVFITNSIIGIQTVTNYKKKEYNTYLVEMVKEGFEEMIE